MPGELRLSRPPPDHRRSAPWWAAAILGGWCNGNTAVFGTVILGSSPSPPATGVFLVSVHAIDGSRPAPPFSVERRRWVGQFLWGRQVSVKCELYANKTWQLITVDQALTHYRERELRCPECFGAVRPHSESKDGVMAAHFEHKIGHPGCSLGHYFDGRSRMHPKPLLK